jgi:subtilisin family serine protease
MKKLFVSLLLVLFSATVFHAQAVMKLGRDYVFADRILVKFKDVSLAKSAVESGTLAGILKSAGVVSVKRTFALKESMRKSAGTSLEKIYTLRYSSPVNPKFLAAKLSKLKGIEWAEPYYLGQLMYKPNDPRYGEQWALRKIKAAEAWEITKGDTNVVIAIDDTGVDWDHPDLFSNIWTNEGEIPNNGIDDDGNGYIDDVHGWDFGGVSGTPDNDPKEDRPEHGTHVAGIASAVTDNGKGIASIGFNCKIMPVKTSQDNIRDANGNPLIAYGYQGIVYAVNNGAKVINTSWGSYSYSAAGQEVIDYAVAHGTLLVGAAGNEGLQASIYPGAYQGALSVGAVDSSYMKAYFSNYGERLDVFAPGVRILSTWQDDTYADWLSGTSMASPFVAGLAGLVFSKFPSYTPEQVAQQIRVTARSIDDTNAARYNFLLGKGVIDAYAAVSKEDAEAVRIVEKNFFDEGDGDGVFEKGEKVGIKLRFKNFLSSTSSLQISLVSMNTYATVVAGSFNAGAVSSGAEFENSSQPFQVQLADNVPENTEVSLLVKFEDGDYSDFQWIKFLANPTFATQANGKISLTFTSKGTMAFNDYPENTQGDGFQYKNSGNLLFEGALMYGTGVKKLDNAARDASGNAQDKDFTPVKPFVIQNPGKIADEQGHAVFNDYMAFGTKLNIQTTMTTYSFDKEGMDDFIIIKYVFKNNSAADITGFRAGLFMDWDIDGDTYDKNITAYDQAGGFGYVYTQNLDPVDAYFTCALISKGEYGFYGIQNDGNDGGINIYDGFSDDEKWFALSDGVNKTNAGPQDVSFVASGGDYDIPAGDSIEVGFAIAVGKTLEDLRSVVATAKAFYDSSLTGVEEINEKTLPIRFSLAQNYPNPFNPTTTIAYSIPSVIAKSGATRQSVNVALDVYNSLGQKIATLVNKAQAPGNYSVRFDASNLPSGVYFYRLHAGSFVATKKMILLK